MTNKSNPFFTVIAMWLENQFIDLQLDSEIEIEEIIIFNKILVTFK